ncbi:YncE family protein [Burkholderia pseudomallei]|uniref:YncE family protein n=1 Tax=Burkholderia pseudomallei TaxID=28450 RepID=UPI0002F0F4FD|nr:YncE family protein [Burkholderia pseudomallei]AJX40454.1 putative wD40/YVTN repeat-like-containing domain beta-propeller repeat protein [Burkholderia pseudomallei]CAJ2977360.1 putative wD40/YVTN repeat-like-containing domain beta-propeller repeat protein [Burkholderia pseudomallei]CAJ5822489.1 putative wD40/YVTN repeat-like-containing domain beta-propeller repeat protein [Burkholderia pseudomallei]CAJ7371266.1 putative wD40/YVTN repeat-like-containing domain beta-propeller repeat protein [B
MNSLKKRRIGIAALLALSAALALSGLAAHRALRAARPAPALLALKRVADIPLPGGATRFDYESIDPNRRLLYIAHLGDAEIVVFDLRASQVTARIGDVSSVHGVLAVTELSRVYASATGTDEVVAIDARTRKIVARIPGGRYPDGMAYAPEAFKLYVSDEYGETETVIDTRTNRRIATIALGGEAGNTQYDPSSRHVFVNDQTHARLVEIDPALDRIVNRFDLPGAKGNHGLLIDSRDRLAFIACEGNDKLLILDMRSMRIAQSFDIGGSPDVLAFDPSLATLYVAGEAGVISRFRVEASGVRKIDEGRLAAHAHVVAVDPSTHRSYFPLKNIGGRPVLRVMRPA